MSRNYKNRCINAVLNYAKKGLFRRIITCYIIVPKKGKLKYIRLCFYSTIAKIMQDYRVDKTIFPSDFYKIDREMVKRLRVKFMSVDITIDDKDDSVEIADMIINTYRRTRRIFLKNMRVIIC